jgi:hypothetical protein
VCLCNSGPPPRVRHRPVPGRPPPPAARAASRPRRAVLGARPRAHRRHTHGSPGASAAMAWFRSSYLPTPPAAACTTTLSPGCIRALVRSRCHAVSPWRITASAWASSTASGTGKLSPGEDQPTLGVAAPGGEQRHYALALGRRADDLRSGDQGQLRRGVVAVLGLVCVGVVDVRRVDLDRDGAGPAARVRAPRAARAPRGRRIC